MSIKSNYSLNFMLQNQFYLQERPHFTNFHPTSLQFQHLAMSSTGNTNPGNFANRPREELQEIASKGGKSRGAGNSGGSGDTTETTSSTGNTNPGNFANRPKEEVQEIASKGGKASSGSFEPGSEKASEAGGRVDQCLDLLDKGLFQGGNS